MSEGHKEHYYWDLKSFIPDNVFSDFEGLTDPQLILPLLNDSEVKLRLLAWTSETVSQEFLRDMLLHYAFENLDQGGYAVTSVEACAFLDTLVWILQSGHWLKVRDEDLEMKLCT